MAYETPITIAEVVKGIYECGAKSQFLTDKSESLMVLYKH
jgi:hypothetical protein